VDPTVDALEVVLARLADVLDRVGPQDRSRPTPCSDWALGALAGHVVGSTDAFAAVLAGDPGPVPARVPEAEATGSRQRDAALRCVAGWRAPGARERTYVEVIELDGGVRIPPIPVDGALLADIQLLDAGVHLHDLTRALGLPDLDDDAVQAAARAGLASARRVLQPGIRGLAGFGAPHEPPADATDVESLLAFAGRAPRAPG